MSCSAMVRMLMIAFTAVTCTVQAATIHVATTGNDAGDGLTWTTAKRTVQAGLNAAQPADQVWVAAGTYDGTITLKAAVALYGGFAGTETDLAGRNWTINETVLNGTENDSVVISPQGATEDTRIDGFTIRNGKGRLSGSYRYGGGIYCYNSSPTIANNTITSNVAVYGGGLSCGACSPMILNNTISGNSAAGGGGGIYCWYASPTIENNMIADNGQDPSPGSGGGVHCSGDSSAKIVDNTIRGNKASNGGGIHCENKAAPAITNNTITNNSAYVGGGIRCYNSSPTIANNVVSGNNAWDSGGGIYCQNSSLTITNNAIAGNSAISGGGIFCIDASSSIANNAIAGNVAEWGGGVRCLAGSVTISNNTISGNGSDWGEGGGIHCDWATTITNTIVAFNSSGVYNAGSPGSISYTCVYGNTAYNFTGISSPVGTNGNISADPLFVWIASPGPDFTWGTDDDDYGDLHLQPGSPCIDAGDPAYAPVPGETDMDGRPRVINNRVDIGADEWTLSGDSNGDGSVDVVDLLMLVDAWGTAAGDADYDPACDFNHDSLVDVVDLLMLVENWGQSGQTVSLSLSGSPMADQAGATATVTATLSAPISIDLTVGLTFGGTATKDTDYTASATQIVIPAGQTSGSPITLTLIGNNSYNPAGTILLTGQPLSGASYAGSNQVAVDLSGTTPEQYLAKCQAWLAQNATQPGVVTLPSGLQYKIITQGTGPRPDANDQVFVAFTITLIDGTVYASNGGTTFGVDEVISGLTEGLQLMPLNAKYMLYIPSNLAYGESGNTYVRPNATLIFEVELKGIQQIP